MPGKINSNCKCTLNRNHLIQKATDLISKPFSSNYIDRHVTILDDFVENSSSGIWLSDVPYVIKLLYLLPDKIESTLVYKSHLLKILMLCRTSPKFTQTSDKFKFGEYLPEYFSAFGYLMIKFKDDEILNIILQIVKDLFCEKNADRNAVNISGLIEAYGESNFPITFAQFMEIVDDGIYVKLLTTLEHLLESPKACMKYIQTGIMNVILTRMHPDWQNIKLNQSHSGKILRTLPHFDLSTKIMWQFLKILQDYPNEWSQPPVNAEAWSIIHKLTKMVLPNPMRKERRNALLLMILSIHSIANIRLRNESSDVLAMICSGFEVDIVNKDCVLQQKLTSDIIDYRYRRIILFFMLTFAAHPELEKYLLQRQVIHAIINIIWPQNYVQWTERQRCKLIKYCLLTLSELLHCGMNDFMECNGPLKLLKIIEGFTRTNIRQCTLISCLHCLWKSLSLGGKEVIKVYMDLQADDIIIELLKYLINLNAVTFQSQHNMMCCFCILAKLNENQKNFRPNYTELCLQYIKRYLNPTKEDFMQNLRVLISCLGFLWDHVTYSVLHMKHFVDIGGIYVMLDLIEVSCFEIQVVGLGILVDLCEVDTSIPFILTWRGDKKTAVSLFLELFRKENDLLSVKLTEKGIISSIKAPLMGKKQRRLTFSRERNTKSSPAIIDILGSIRPKVCAMLHILNCNKADISHAVNERYKISTGPLSIVDEITKPLAENYFLLKYGEVWYELKTCFSKTGMDLLLYDKQILISMIRRYQKLVAHIKTVQERLMIEEHLKEQNEERILYNNMKEGHLTEALETLIDLRYAARCSENTFRYVDKTEQQVELASTLDQNKQEHLSKFHPTYMHDIRVTPVFKQTIDIKSNLPIYKQESLKVVSPIDSWIDLKGFENID